MFLDYFEMHTDPFKLGPNLKFLFGSKAHEETIAHLVFGIEQGEDIILISGDIGTGKTLALHYLIDQITSRFHTVFINVTQFNFTELLKLVLAELNVEFAPGGDNADYLTLLKQELARNRQKKNKVLLIVDEAQNLDAQTLEGVRLLTNLAQPGGQVLQIVLAGQPGLESLIRSPELQQLRQRIRVHYRLDYLDRKELDEYVAHRLKVAGCPKNIFKKQALSRIYELSNGVPRLVNLIASKALIAAFVDNAKVVSRRHVEADDLPEVPAATPVAAAPPPAAEPTVAEPPAAVAAPSPEIDGPQVVAEVMPLIAESGDPAARDGAAPAPSPTDETGRPAVEPQRASPARMIVACIGFVLVAVVVYLVWFDDGRILDRLNSGSQAAASRPVVNEETAADPASADPAAVEASGGTTPTETTTPSQDPAQPGETETPPATTAPAPGNTTPPATNPPPTVAENTEQFRVHVGSFRTAGLARNLVTRITDRGYRAWYTPVTVRDRQWQRVYVGPYGDRAAAAAARQELLDRRLTEFAKIVRATSE